MSHHRRLALSCALAIVMLLGVGAAPAAAQSPPVQAEVVRVIDGDTIQVRIGKVTQLVRYIGIDTPETTHPTRGAEPYGEAAKEANRALVEEQVVTLVFDVQEVDHHLGLLAYVWVGDRLVNAELVKQGLATAATFPPNVRHAAYFRQLERNAREWRQGFWADPTTTSQVQPAAGSQEAEAAARAAAPSQGAGVRDVPTFRVPAYSAPSSSSSSPSSVSAPSPSGRSSSSSGPANVQGYQRKDGSYVAPYTRSAPRR